MPNFDIDLSEIETPNQYSIVFAENFIEGRSFNIKLTKIINPDFLASAGYVKIYTLEYNSNNLIERNEKVMLLIIE
jgi:hypothetical protein